METGLREKAFCLFLWAGIFKKERFVIGIVRENVLLASKCFKISFGLFKHFLLTRNEPDQRSERMSFCECLRHHVIIFLPGETGTIREAQEICLLEKAESPDAELLRENVGEVLDVCAWWYKCIM